MGRYAMKDAANRAAGAWRLARRIAAGAWREFSHHNGPQAAAAFSFFCFLSLLALLVLSGAVLGMVLSGNPQLLRRIIDYIARIAPGLSGTVTDALEASMDLKGVLGVGGALGLLLTGTKVIDSLQVWFAAIWGTEKPRFLRRKGKSLATLAFLAFMGLLGFGVNAAFFLARRWESRLNLFAGVFAFALSTCILFAAAAFVYSYAVEARLGWRRVWKGALFAALLVNPMQMLLAWYYSHLGDFSAVYGSFAGVVLMVMSIYYAGYIIFLGAALNRHLDDLSGSPVEGGESPRAGTGGGDEGDGE